MSEPIEQDQRYSVGIYEAQGPGGALIFNFSPESLQHARGLGGPPKRVLQFIVTVRQAPDGLTFDWSGTQDDPDGAREEIQAEITARMVDRRMWIDRVTSLVGQVDDWAKGMSWSTRRVEKKLDDAWIGEHRVPALLLQEDTCRVLLEPVGRSTPGAEGVVDLYLMPAYDDIATLYYFGNQWNLLYVFPRTRAAVTVREADATPLSKQALEKVLAELRKHAA